MKIEDLKKANDIEYNMERLEYMIGAAKFILKNPSNEYGIGFSTGNWSMRNTVNYYPEFVIRATQAVLEVAREMYEEEHGKLMRI